MPLQFEIKRRWSELSTETQKTLQSVFERPVKQCSLLSSQKHFLIHYDTVGYDAPDLIDNDKNKIPDFIDSVAYYFEYCLEKETRDLGYLPPPGDNLNGGGSELDVYIQNLSNSEYGYTTLDETLPSSYPVPLYTSYITIDNDYFGYYSSGYDGLKVTIAHELFHTIQLGNYGTWLEDVFYYEILSTWMEHMIFPEIKDYHQYLNQYFSKTNIPFWKHNGYDLSIWGIFLSLKYNPKIMEEILTGFRYNKPLLATDIVLKTKKSGFVNDFLDFSIWIYYTSSRAKKGFYFPDAQEYPLISGSSIQRYSFNAPKISFNNNANNLCASYIFIPYNKDTISIILTNAVFEDAVSGKDKTYSYGFDIADHYIDEYCTRLKNGANIKFTADNIQDWKNIYLLNNESVKESGKIKVFPNPFYLRKNSAITFSIPNNNKKIIDLYIFSNSNKLIFNASMDVKTLLGQESLLWDGRDNNGNSVQSGIYIYYLNINGEDYIGKFAVIK